MTLSAVAAEAGATPTLFAECSVCGAPPSGVHYGSLTCEACKAFFKRTVHSCLTYSCIRPGSQAACPVRGNRRRQCAACRWRRCLAVQMRPELIRSVGSTVPAPALPTVAAIAWKPNSSHGSSKAIVYCDRSPPISVTPRIQAPTTPSEFQPQTELQKPRQQCLPLLQPLAEPRPMDAVVSETCPIVQRLIQLDSPLLTMATPAGTGGLKLPTQMDSESGNLADSVSRENDRLVHGLVSFAKGLPGFCALPMADRKCLLQHHWLALNVWEIANNSVPYDGNIRFSASFQLHEGQSSQHTRSFSGKAGQQMRALIKRLTELKVSRVEFLLLKAVFLLDAEPQFTWADHPAIEASQSAYLGQLSRVCEDPIRKSTLLLLWSSLSAMKIHSVGYWASVVERTKFLPVPLLSEMLEFSLTNSA